MVTVKIIPNDKGNPPGKLADAELIFTHTIGEAAALQDEATPVGDALLSGLRLIGFGVWQKRDGARSVTFPSRAYSVNGERRSFALLRPVSDNDGQDRVRDLVLQAYREYEETDALTALEPPTTSVSVGVR